MVDLHMHSKYSDGTDNAKEILINSEKLGLSVISITDHNTFDAYNELDNLNISDYFSGKVIKGIEITTSYKGRRIELLGYNFNETKELEEFINYYKDRKKSINIMKILRIDLMKKIDALDLKYDKELLKEMDDVQKFETHLYNSILENNSPSDLSEKLKENYVSDGHSFYKKCVQNPDSMFFMNYTKFDADIYGIVSLAHKCNGKLFLAHPFEYGISNIEVFLNDLYANVDIDGIECYHSSFNKEQVDYLINYANKNNLYISGGSDYHGKNREHVKLGYVMNNTSTICDDVVNNFDFLNKNVVKKLSN